MKKKLKLAIFVFVSLIFFAPVAFAVTCPSGGFKVEGGVCIPTLTGLPDTGTSDPVVDIATNFLKWLLAIFGVLAITSFVVSGVMYFLASGNEAMAEKAKKQIIWSIIGVAVALGGYIIIIAIESILSASSTI